MKSKAFKNFTSLKSNRKETNVKNVRKSATKLLVFDKNKQNADHKMFKK